MKMFTECLIVAIISFWTIQPSEFAWNDVIISQVAIAFSAMQEVIIIVSVACLLSNKCADFFSRLQKIHTRIAMSYVYVCTFYI